MNSKMVGVGLLVSFLVGAVAGGIGGWYFGMHSYLNAWVQEQAGDVNGNVVVLRNLREGKTDAAMEFVESRLDDDLVVLVPEDVELREHVREEMHSALRTAKQYRTDYPRTSSRSGVDEMVKNALSRQIPADE